MSVLSPCARNCCLDQQDICIGCGRTVQEIVRWGGADDEEKHEILMSAQARRLEREKLVGTLHSRYNRNS